MSLLSTLKFVACHPLNRQQRLSALIGFFKWQLGSRLVPGDVVYSWVNGAKFIVRPGETGATGNIYCGLHEFADMAYVLHVLTAEDLFVDVGANVGSYTLLACAAKGAKGYCFEPVPSTFQRLMDNIRLNDLSARVVALNIGISDKEGRLSFIADENCMNHVVGLNETSINTIDVKVCSLDSVLGAEPASVMKIDVEGFETAVINGAHATLSNQSLHSVIMELNGSGRRYGFDEYHLLSKMRDHGFSTYKYDPFSRKLESLGGDSNPSGNTLFIRNERLVKERIVNAPSTVFGTIRL